MNEKRKHLLRTYKATLRPMGVYQLRNVSNNKIFIGSTMNLDGIFNRHVFQLNMGIHSSKSLQSDWNETGSGNFVFELLEELFPRKDPEFDYQADLEFLEDLWLEKLSPYGDNGYNEKKKTREERLSMIAANKRNF